MTKRGWRAIVARGRPPESSALVGPGSRTPASTTAERAATAAWARKVAANRWAGHRAMVWLTSCGPMMPAKTPPAITAERARGRRSGATQSAAAKRKDRTTAA